MIRDNYVHEQGTAAAVALHPCHQVGFSPSCWGPCPAVCPFYQNSPVFSVREETEMLCSNPADCCAAFCSRAPVCPLPNDWAKDNTATRTTVSLCPANELRDAWLPQEQPKGTECPEPALLTGRQLEKSGKKPKPEALSTCVCTHTKTQAHTRTQLIEGDSHFSRGELHAELHLLWGFCASLLLVYL